MKKVLILLFISSILFSCEEEFTPKASADIDELVVEGYIEAGDNARPPFVILTRALSFFSEISQDAINDIYVHDADVIISNGGESYPLTEICLDNLTPEQKEQIGPLLGVDVDSLSVNICIYLDLSFQLMGKEGESYDLDIKKDKKHLTATTTIPNNVGIDSLWFIEVPGLPIDTLRNLRALFSDPSGIENFYRYFGSVDGGPYNTAPSSIFNDPLFDGKSFSFDLANPNPVDTSRAGFRTFGTYKVGTKISIKWCGIDADHYGFWSSLELNRNNQGPFSNYTLVSTNINGGLGIWGGYVIRLYDLDVK